MRMKFRYSGIQTTREISESSAKVEIPNSNEIAVFMEIPDS